ncbi:MAG: hypothetical protein GF307_06715 [candidate division Zixibacteria bacterium]|nr:hypothetical protein [candidate division Zixibacteria bacterium]
MKWYWLLMVRKKAKRVVRKKGNRSLQYIVAGLLCLFVLGFVYLWETEKVRSMLIEEQRLIKEAEMLREDNTRLELELANITTLDYLKRSIDEPGFGFPEPDKVLHHHWYNNREEKQGTMIERATDLVLDWLKEGMDVNQTTYADSLR